MAEGKCRIEVSDLPGGYISIKCVCGDRPEKPCALFRRVCQWRELDDQIRSRVHDTP